MTFKEGQAKPIETPQEIRRQLEINSVDDFLDVLAHGELTAAANWFEMAKDDPRYDAHWMDHWSKKLMDAFCTAGRFEEANKYVNYAESAEEKTERQRQIDKLMGRDK